MRQLTRFFQEYSQKSKAKRLYAKGLYHFQGWVFNTALDEFSQAIALDPTLARAYDMRGKTYFHLARYSDAVADSQKAIELDQKMISAYFNCVVSFFAMNEYESALEWVKQTLDLNPNDIDAIYYLGRIQFELGKFDECIETFTKCIAQKLTSAEVYLQRGIAYYYIDNKAKSNSDIAKAQELDSAYSSSRIDGYFAVALHFKGKYIECIELCSKNLDRDQTDSFYIFYRGDSYLKLSEFEKAIVDFKCYLKYDWKNKYVYEALFSAMTSIKNFNGMFNLLVTYKKLFPESAYYYFASGLYWTHYKKYDKSLEAYTAALEAYNEEITNDNLSSVAYNNRGYTYAELGRYKEAIEDYNTAIQLDPDFVFAHNNRGFAKYKLGDFPEALDDLNKCLTLNPEHGIAYYNRGLVYIALGQKAEACRDFTRAHQLNEPQAAKALTEHCGTSLDAPTP